jgi:predicted hotdog family 3-hydroxylacyl-ACP dehydratase
MTPHAMALEPVELMPHGPSMVFVERVLEHDDRQVTCRVTAGTADADFLEDGVVPLTMAVEYMAQVVCVYAGLRSEPDHRQDVGFIIAVRDLELHVSAFTVGQALDVQVTWVWGEAQLGRFDAVIEHEGHVLAQASMSVVRPTEAELAAYEVS